MTPNERHTINTVRLRQKKGSTPTLPVAVEDLAASKASEAGLAVKQETPAIYLNPSSAERLAVVNLVEAEDAGTVLFEATISRQLSLYPSLKRAWALSANSTLTLLSTASRVPDQD